MTPRPSSAMTSAGDIDLLWHGAAPWGVSAFALQGRLVTNSLRELGWRIGYSSDVSDRVRFAGRPLWPAPRLSGRSLTANAVAAFGRRTKRVVAFVDFPRLADRDANEFAELEIAVWAPVHLDPLPFDYLELMSLPNVRPLTVAEFARARLEEHGIAASTIPHGIDPAMLRAADRLSTAGARERLGLPTDAFVVTTVGVNGDWRTNRKSWPELAQAVARAQHACRDLVWHVHSPGTDALGGIEFEHLIDAAGVDARRFHRTDPDIEPLDGADMAAIYRAADVLALTSGGEGFGIPVIEAQGCGIPVVVSDFSAQPELVHEGWIVPGQRRWVPGIDSWMFTPSIDGIAASLIDAARGVPPPLHRRDDPRRRFDHERLVETHWQPFLEDWLGLDRPVATGRQEGRTR